MVIISKIKLTRIKFLEILDDVVKAVKALYKTGGERPGNEQAEGRDGRELDDLPGPKGHRRNSPKTSPMTMATTMAMSRLIALRTSVTFRPKYWRSSG